MPSNEERREVAAGLRDMAKERVWHDNYFIAYLIGALSMESRASVGEILERLADLIEPDERTCGLRSRFTGAFCYECTECGHGMKPDWNFCPSCGAIVIGGQPR